MLDIKRIREHSADLVQIYRTKLFDEEACRLVEQVVLLDHQRRSLLANVEELKQKRNEGSKAVGLLREVDERQKAIAQMEGLKQQIASLDAQLNTCEEEMQKLLLQLPNVPTESVPIGQNDAQNQVVRYEGKIRDFSFGPKPHWELGEKLRLLDFERGVKIAGSRFYLLTGLGAALQRALISLMLDVHIRQGYTEVLPPYMVREQCLYGTAQLPKFGENLYRDAEDDFYFIPTAEVPITNMYREEILPEGQLPIRHVAYSACFRREKLAAGRDTRGIKRGHQFDKVELVQFVHPERGREALRGLLEDAADVLRQLELPYRVVQMCTGDLSFAACEKYDLEVFAPGMNEWLEVSSCSHFGDFQARRTGIRYKAGQNKPQFVHTLNGSGLALPRTLIAVLENYQEADGSVRVPAALRPYLSGQPEVISMP